MIRNRKIFRLLFLLPLFFNGCKTNDAAFEKFHFTLMDAGKTNISFNNKLTESDSVNVFTNEYMYNGSGVGIGDFNNDGLQDIFFAGSMVSCSMYINKGNFVFQDITKQAGLETNRWCTGVTVVDINNDGFQDIYVCASHSKDSAKRKNELFINDGHLHFTEQAAAYHLDDAGYATQAAFFDYDKDGDLDMYLLNHRLYSHTANNIELKDTSGNSPAQDKLYRNEGNPAGLTHPIFTDVSVQAGIKEDGYGLGLVISDINGDGWPDVYVANDYIGNDLLWLNNKNGTFSNTISTSLRHQSYNSMGTDAADINNDGLPDISTLDMQPETNDRKKMMASANNQEKFDMQQRFGYQPSFVRNMLQLNNGNRKIDNKAEPFFSEIGQMAGINETDWSWSVLMADFDNDGWKDIHITNGLGKDVTNNDYTAFRNNKVQTNNYTFGGIGSSEPLEKGTMGSLRRNIDQYGAVPMDNYFFHNNGNLTFTNISRQTGIAIPSISNGAAYADLDNDGDLDLVINNLNQEAFLWKNELRKSATDSTDNFISLQLSGPPGNFAGFGTKAFVYNNNTLQFAEQFPVRGFSSSVEERLHFGIGKGKNIDSIKMIWPDGKMQLLKNVPANQFLKIDYRNASAVAPGPAENLSATLFTDISDAMAFDFKHTEADYFDFGFHQPLPQKYSQLGPCIATGDINGDGLEDFFVGGAANQSGKIFLQKTDGRFSAVNLTATAKPGEDLGAVLFDADGDKDLDLIITGGSFEFGYEKNNQPVLYVNDGKGNFKPDISAIPEITDITDAVATADYDSDGDLDIFIGGRLLPQQYPQSPRSYILQNDHGKFKDVTATVCPALVNPGMISGAIFTDFNNDKRPDLIICGEWTTIQLYKNENGKFKEITDDTGLSGIFGLWRSLQQADVDNDGDMDYLAGNMGLNNKYHVSKETPMKLFAGDLDKNGFAELIPAYYIKDTINRYELFPALDRNQLAEQLPAVKKKYLLHADYARVSMSRLKEDFESANWMELTCETSSSVWIENLGNGKFEAHALPLEAQLAPVNCIVARDVDRDGNIDLLIAGNEYQTEANTGRYDASYGLFLKGNGKGNFAAQNILHSGLIIDGDVKDMQVINTKNKGNLLLVAPNNSKLKTFQLNISAKNN